MRRGIGDKTILETFTEDFCKVVEKHCKYIVCSGFVAIAHGRSRSTEDIDMIIEKLPKDKFVKLHKDLIKAGFECMQSSDGIKVYDDYLCSGLSVRYTRKGEFLPEMEIKFAKDELDNEQIKNRTKIPFTDLNVYFSSIESNIAFKEELLRADKDLEDAKHLRIIYEGKLDEDKINKIKKQIKKYRFGK
jgi:hypothetical protein